MCLLYSLNVCTSKVLSSGTDKQISNFSYFAIVTLVFWYYDVLRYRDLAIFKGQSWKFVASLEMQCVPLTH